MQDITVIIITKNEEQNISKCIASVSKVAGRIVVVDSGSTDETVSIAKKMGAEVLLHEFSTHAEQLNWALENANIKTTWTMRMDADEELTEELICEINQQLNTIAEDVSGIELRRRVYFMGRWIKHGGIYPTMILRLFRTGKAVCEQRAMDEHFVLTEGRSICFLKDFIDYNTKSLEWWIGKHNRYSDKELDDYIQRKQLEKSDSYVKPRFWGKQAERKRWLKQRFYYNTPLMRRAHWYFIYRYFLRGGFLDGREGLAFHFLQGYWYRFLVDAKIYEWEKDKTH